MLVLFAAVALVALLPLIFTFKIWRRYARWIAVQSRPVWVAEYAPPLLAYVPAASGPSSSAAFDAGKTDWNNWFAWVHGKSGELRAGIDFWAEVRNDKARRPSSCRSAMHGDISAEFYDGCAAANKFLSVVDRRRMTEPDYRQGWNAGYKTTGNP